MFPFRSVIGFLVIAASAAAHTPAGKEPAQQLLTALPAWFEPNLGRFAPDVKFFSRGAGGALLVRSDGAMLRAVTGQLHIGFRGGNARALIEGTAPLGSRSSYLTGNDPRRWKHGVPHFGRVLARQVYPGIDVVYYLTGSTLEFDFVVAPGSDPGRIRLAFSGAGKPRLDSSGDLVFTNGLRQKRPVAYQESEAGRDSVSAAYRLDRKGEVEVLLGDYDRARPLVIDPILQAGYLGGDHQDRATAITVDRSGNVWITGASASLISAPGQGEPIQDAAKGVSDAFVAKLTRDVSGKLNLAYWTLLGGEAADEATAITTDELGFVYIAGRTESIDFPRAGTAFQENLAGGVDAFVTKLNPAEPGGGAVWYSQFYGGNRVDVANAIAVDSLGAIYVAGYSTSDSLPGAGDQYLQCCNRGGYEGFLFKVNPDSGSPLAYSTFFGGGRTDEVRAIAVDRNGDVFLTGYTQSVDFPITVDASRTEPDSIFLAKLDIRQPGLNALQYATYIGGGALDMPQSIALDAQGGIWIAGYTLSSDFPVTGGAYRSSNAGLSDLFVLRFDYANRTGPNAIGYSTYLGGSDADVLYSMSMTPQGTLALAGYTYSPDFLQIEPSPPAGLRSAPGAFVALFDPARQGSEALVYSAILSGTLTDAATAVVADPAGRLLVVGFTYSADFPVTDESSKLSPGGLSQGFILVADPAVR
jgi:hypothetical protein